MNAMMQWLSRVERRRLAAWAIGLAVILFLALNTFGHLGLRQWRLDLTGNKQFTLSDGTRHLLGSMKEPVTLRLYASSSLREANPFLGAYADRVHDMLAAYADASDGKLTVEYIDPEPFSVEEDRAVGFGLQAVPLETGTAYFGIAGTNATDDVDILPALSPDRESFLEYDLTRLVYNLANPDKPVVALISSLPLDGDPALQYRPWQVMEQLKQFFDVRTQAGDVDAIDPAAKLLLIVHPQNLSDKTLYAIDQFVLKGGKALVLVDPNSEAQQARQNPQQGPTDTSSTLGKLFDAWGIAYDKDKVVGDPRYARQVQFPVGGRQQVIDYLAWLSLDGAALNQDQVTTAELNRLNFQSAGALAPADKATTTFTALASTSPDAELFSADEVRFYPDPMKIASEYKSGGKPLVLAARVEGPAKSAFDKAPEGAPAGEHVAEAKSPINVMVIADTDLLDDRAWMAMQNMFGQQMGVPVADNANLVANGLDYLAGSDALTGLRGREVTLRPFTRVAEIRREAEGHYRAKEQELQQRLDDLQNKLGSMKVSESDGQVLLSDAQNKEIEGFRGQLLDTRRQLRDVQLALRKDIDELRQRVRFLNIAAVPLAIAALALVIYLIQRARYRRRIERTA